VTSDESTFTLAFTKAMAHEVSSKGGYANIPHDRGGETYSGISRRWWPSLPIWPIIDEHKKHMAAFPSAKPTLNERLNADSNLHEMVRDFYRDEFWKRPKLNQVAAISADIAVEMFDTGVNMDSRDAIKILQAALNYLNVNQKLFKDVDEDGSIGPVSLAALRLLVGRGETDLLLKFMNVLQGMHYMTDTKENPEQELFMRSWFRRVSIDIA
jgi:lysozyme family protein